MEGVVLVITLTTCSGELLVEFSIHHAEYTVSHKANADEYESKEEGSRHGETLYYERTHNHSHSRSKTCYCDLYTHCECHLLTLEPLGDDFCYSDTTVLGTYGKDGISEAGDHNLSADTEDVSSFRCR